MSLKSKIAAKPSTARNHQEPQFKPQAKLKLGSSNDVYEKEADQVADHVVQPTLNYNGEPAFFQPNPILQRLGQVQAQKKEKAVEEESKDSEMGTESDQLQVDSSPKIQAMSANVPNDESIQKKDEQSGGGGADSIESDLSASKGGGSPLDDDTKNQMESGIGSDFSNVRVHTDSKAQEMNQKIGAQAFTNGNDVYFNQGKYNPSSKDGQHLLAHELAHTVQQGASGEKVQRKEDEDGNVGSWSFRTKHVPIMDSMTTEELSAYCYSKITGLSQEELQDLIQKGQIILSGNWLPIENNLEDGDYYYFGIKKRLYFQLTGFYSTGEGAEDIGKESETPESQLSNAVSISDGELEDVGSGTGTGEGTGSGSGISKSGFNEDRGADQRREGAIERDEDYETLPKEEQIEVVDETNKRFYEMWDIEEGYQLKDVDPESAKEMWREMRDDVLIEKAQIDQLPEKLQKIIKENGRPVKPEEIQSYNRLLHTLNKLDDTQLEALELLLHSGDKPVPVDYEEMRKIAEMMHDFTPMDYIEYMSIISGDGESMEDFRKSIERFLKRKEEKKQEAEEMEVVKTKLSGLEELYKQYKKFKSLEALSEISNLSSGVEGKFERQIVERTPGINSTDIEESRKELLLQMKENGFNSIKQFEHYIKKYEKAFEKATVRLAEDHLFRYRHILYEEEKKLSNDDYLSTLFSQLKSSGAETHYDEADQHSLNAANLSTADDRISDPYAEMKADERQKAKDSRSSGKKAIKENVSSFLVQEDQFEHEDFSHISSKKEMKTFLLEYIQEKYQSIYEVLADLNENSEHIYTLDKLYAGSVENQGLEDGSIYHSIVTEKAKRIQNKEWFKNITIAILAIALTIVTLGAAAPFALAAGIASVGVSLYSVYEAVESYKEANDANNVGFLTDDPSLIWVVLAVAGAAFDVGALMPIMKSANLIKATKAFNQSGDALTLEKELLKITEISDQMKANILKSAKIEASTNQALSDLLKTSAGTLKVLIVPGSKTIPRLVATSYIMARKGIISFKQFLLKLEVDKIIKNAEGLTAAENLTLKQAFNKGQKLYKTNPELADDLTKAITEGDFAKMERILNGTADVVRSKIFQKGLNYLKRWVGRLTNKTPDDLSESLINEGWVKSFPQASDPLKIQHTIFTKTTKSGSTYLLDFHPGGGIHSTPYWKIYNVTGGGRTILGRIGANGFSNFDKIIDSPVFINGVLVN